MAKRVLIIGGGVAGLSAGAYLQMNGYHTEIFEAQHVAGGVCTAWDRQDYTIDPCIHWLVGTQPGSELYRRWNELLPMDEFEFVRHDSFGHVRDEQGREICIFNDVDRLEAELSEKAPEDRHAIHQMTRAIRKLSRFEMDSEKTWEVMSWWERLWMIGKMLPFFPLFARYTRFDHRQYAQKFKNPLLQRTIQSLFDPDTTVLFSLITLAWMHRGDCGYPVGGSRKFTQALVDRYNGLGGKIHYHAPVVEILRENHQANGLRLQDGRTYFADYIISAADLQTTVYRLLQGHYRDPAYEKFFNSHPTFPSLVFVAYGVPRPLDHLPHMVVLPSHPPLVIDPETAVDEIPLRIHHFDPTLAPQGKSLVTTMLPTRNYTYWTQLKETAPRRYWEEKERIANTLWEQLQEALPDLGNETEMIDVATPSTFLNFTKNWRGSYEGWVMTPQAAFQQLPSRIRGIDRLYLCGHWVAVGGGLPAVMLSGRGVAQQICQRDGRNFHTSFASGMAIDKEKTKV